jgi:Zn-dependent protease with chaperone function
VSVVSSDGGAALIGDVNSAPTGGRQALEQLRGRIDPVPISFLYRVGLILVAAVMIVLPLIYVALIALVAYGVYLHATNDTFLLGSSRHGGGGGRAGLLAYLGPIVIGAILLLFMIKPLFARRGKSPNIKTLKREDEPLLFEFVDRLCDLVGAPRPRKIKVDCQVNASAGFGGGIFSLLGHNLVLTIGLPLAAGLNLRQLTGVLAHEFGHFAQGTAMRVSYIVRSINGWFARVVYERDAWDEQLESIARGSDSGGIAIVLWSAKGLVWVTRRTLWVLMYAGHAVSCFLLRQMEFDADRYEARVSGSETFAQTCRILPQLSVASNGAFSDLARAWNERKLCDDLPALILHNAHDMPEKLRKKLAAVVEERKTGWFDTHPADRDRIASAARENTPGLFTVEMPARVLFSDFGALSREASQALYREMLGSHFDQAAFVPTDHLHSAQAGEVAWHQALRRMFQDRLTLVRPLHVFPYAAALEADRETLAGQLITARTRMNEMLEGMGDAVERIGKVDDELIRIRNARGLLSAGFQKTPQGDTAGLNAASVEAQVERNAVDARFAALEQVATERFAAAIALARTPELAAQFSAEELPLVDRVVIALQAFAAAYPAVIELRDQYLSLAALLTTLNQNSGNEALITEIRQLSSSITAKLKAASDGLGGAASPFDHAKAGLNLAEFVIDAIPPADDLGAVFSKCEAVLDRAFGIYSRGMGCAAHLTERVETSLGLEPAADPPDKEEPAADESAA